MSYVYLLRAGENHYKVGVAKSVKKRLAGIQTSNPVKIEIVAVKLVDDAYAVEGQLHERLKEWNVSGEWFGLSPEQVIDLLIEIGRLPEPDLAINTRLRDILARQEFNQKRIEDKLNRVVSLANQNVDRVEIAPTQTLDTVKPPLPLKPKRTVITDEELLEEAIEIVRAKNKASTSLLQRRLKIGYGRAARLIEKMEESGIIGAEQGSRPRKVLVHNEAESARTLLGV